MHRLDHTAAPLGASSGSRSRAKPRVPTVTREAPRGLHGVSLRKATLLPCCSQRMPRLALHQSLTLGVPSAPPRSPPHLGRCPNGTSSERPLLTTSATVVAAATPHPTAQASAWALSVLTLALMSTDFCVLPSPLRM